MKHLIALFLALCAFAAQAQVVPIQLGWTNPPQTSVDGVPITLTGIEVHWATAAIADAAACDAPCTGARAAQATLGVTQATTQNISATNGSTLYFRLRSVAAGGKSAFSNQASKLITLSTVPMPPTGLTIIVTVTQLDDGSVQMAMLVDENRALTIYNGG